MVEFHPQEISFELPNEEAVAQWLEELIKEEKKTPSALSYIFCSDEYLLKMNKDHLNHDYYTDVITFDYCEGEEISGDVFISIDRVQENAKGLGIDFEEELRRVMAHGLLHLLGYKDKSEEEQATMRAKEDFYLALFQKNYTS